MKAIAIRQYGEPDVLEPADLPDPKVGPDSVLVRVVAAGANPVDFKIRRGFLDPFFDSYFPLVPGWDVAGIVEQIGASVSEFAVGDEVVGYVRKDHIHYGTYAELVSCPVRTLARRPTVATFEQSAALPLAGLTAYQALTKVLTVGGEDTVLVHAAAGGVGSLAVQLARESGARVIGTAGEHNHGYLAELGAEPVTHGEGLTDRVRTLAPEGVDAVFDLVGGQTLQTTPDVLAAGGRLASVHEPPAVTALGGTYVFVRPNATDLGVLVRLVAEAKLRVPVARTLPLSEAAEAHRLLEDGHVAGKLVLTT